MKKKDIRIKVPGMKGWEIQKRESMLKFHGKPAAEWFDIYNDKKELIARLDRGELIYLGGDEGYEAIYKRAKRFRVENNPNPIQAARYIYIITQTPANRKILKQPSPRKQ